MWTIPSPAAIDFTPGELLGCVSGELGLRKYLEAAGHELIVTSEKDGPEFERHLAEAEVVISQPFWPAYLSAERIAKAPNLKLALTAGIGSDHVDLQAAIDAEAAMGPLDGRWRIAQPDGKPLLSLSLTDRGEGRRDAAGRAGRGRT
mgnify:CR=1 FL=1